MTTFEILLQQIGLFVIYILAGVTLVRTKVLNRETLEPISKFVIKMALPVMIFINIIDGVNKEILTGSWSILLIAAGFYAVMFLVSFGMTKFFHLSDLHIGLKLYNRDLLEDQKFVLQQVVEQAKKEKPDAVVIAGDIYDKAVPSAEAVSVFDWFVLYLKKEVPDF